MLHKKARRSEPFRTTVEEFPLENLTPTRSSMAEPSLWIA